MRKVFLAAALCLFSCGGRENPPDPAYLFGTTAPPPGCTPTTCAALNVTCGAVDDGCGGQLDCGGCQGVTCEPRQCELDMCGEVPMGCGVIAQCGSCVEGTLCNAQHRCGPRASR